MAEVKSSVTSSFKVEKLSDENYDTWSFVMKMLLAKEGVWDVVCKPRPASQDDLDDEYKANEEKALQIISLSCERSQVVYLRRCKTGKEAWDALKSHHQQESIGAQIRIMKNLFSAKLSVNGSMREHLTELFNWFDKLGEMDAELSTNVSVSVILDSLNEEYDSLVTAIEAWDESRLTLQNVKAKLVDEWEKRSSANQSSSKSTAMKVNLVFTCYGCGGIGHMKRNCPDLRNVIKQIRKEKHENKEQEDGASAKVARFGKWYCSISMKEVSCSQVWIVDSGATCHMCADENQFTVLKRSNTGKITLADEKLIDSVGVGKVKVGVLNGGRSVDVELENILLVPGLNGNLISVKCLTKKGFSVNFYGSECRLLDGTHSWKIAEWTGVTYELCQEKRCCRVPKQPPGFERTNKELDPEFCIHEWHRRLSHRNLKDIRGMQNEGLRIKNCDCNDVCEACLKGKMARKSFPKKATPVSNILDCIISDVCGPLQVETVVGKKYFVTYTDVYSGYTEVVLLRQKSEVTDHTINFIEKMKNQLDKKPKIFRSDRGGEYVTERPQSYFKKEGIIYQYALSHTPQQNGIAERKNRTLLEAVKTMLVNSGFPKSLWGEALCTAVYTQNRILDSDKRKSPFELIYGRKPGLKMFHEFGLDAFVMVPYEKRRKLDDKAKRMKFVGYDEESKGYRFIDENYKITLSRDASFLNTRCPLREALKESKEFDAHFYEDICDEEVFYGGEDRVGDACGDSGEVNFIGECSRDRQETEGVEDDEVEVIEVSDSPERPVPSREATVAPRRSERIRDMALKPNYFSGKAIENLEEPRNYDETMRSPHSSQWLEAMQEELNSIQANDTWELTELPAGRKPVGSKWVFKNKMDENGKLVRRKARLVAQGFSQKYGVDFDEVFAPVVRSATMRLLLSVAGVRGYLVKHFDVKTAFLNGKLSEEIYMKQPPGFERNGQVLKLKKSLYGLKQAARAWNDELHRVLTSLGCKQSQTDKCLYSLASEGEVCYLLIHVDDLLTATNSEKLLEKLIKKIENEFELKDLGEARSYLGIQITRDGFGHFSLNQSNYIEQIVKVAGLEEAKNSRIPLDSGYYKLDGKLLESNEVYRKLIGMLLYVSTNTRPDITASVAILSQKVSKPRDVDLNEVKRVVRYLKETKFYQLKMSMSSGVNQFRIYSDSDWAENQEDRKSMSGYFISMNGGAISWSSRKQDVVALSSTEAEYVALTEACKEMIWCGEVMRDFDQQIPDVVTVLTDSQICINMINNQKFSGRTKHIDIKYYYVREKVSNSEVNLKYIPTENNLADMFTKPKLKNLREKAGLKIEN